VPLRRNFFAFVDSIAMVGSRNWPGAKFTPLDQVKLDVDHIDLSFCSRLCFNR
jgi:hypothetical protein